MGSVNTNYKPGLDHYKGQILGFTKSGFATYANQVGLNAIDTCECCGEVIHSQLSDADFCPICAIMLELTTEQFVKDYCLPKYKDKIIELNSDPDVHKFYRTLTRGFKAGINYGVENAYVSIKNVFNFDTFPD